MNVLHDTLQLDDDPHRIDHEAVWRFLSTEAPWGRWRTRAIVEDELAAAWRLVGAYRPDGEQVAFARAVSDGYGVAYLADVFVAPGHRRTGLGSALVKLMLDGGPKLRWMLHTTDAHGFYRRLGFTPPDPSYLERRASVG